jgi:hypothetical protein
MKGPTLFTLALLAFTCVLIGEGSSLVPASRTAPLWVLVPTAALLVFQLLSELLPHLERGAEARGDGGAAERRFDARSVGGPEWSRRDTARWRGARLTGWLLLLLALVGAFGFFAAVPLFVAPYLRVEAGLRWSHSIGFAAILVGALYLVFGVWVEVPFPEGRAYRIAAGLR